ncbi:MAG: tetratricopeptide repeat protein [Deltaproteobacteria bacterium]|nr:tetratricopeptide repeat protein [Deltaproteobacteria bacterium]
MKYRLQLGPFVVGDRIGAGAMGEVYAGRHVAEERDVAIKVITRDAAARPRFQEEFRREVRAMARLDHPNIIQIYDLGTISEELAERSSGKFVAGSPYFVMELGSNSLLGVRFPLPWRRLATLLSELLAAVGHAHARGVLHRDIKPANLLRVTTPEGQSLRLSDFGIAWAADRDGERFAESAEGMVGTPIYMAPEQFDASWRDHGPFTDLYEIGIVAYEMSMGAPPFRASSTASWAQHHRATPLPRLEALGEDYPSGFADWIRTMAAKAPGDRFQTAADAAAALQALDRLTIDTAAPGAAGSMAPDTGAAWLAQHRSSKETMESSQRGEALSVKAPLARVALSDLGRATRIAEVQSQRPALLAGVGAAIAAIRQPRLSGRAEERRLLADALQRVLDQGGVEVVALEGAAGVGKSRLAEWLCEHAAEFGLAMPLRADHDRLGSPWNRLGRMMADTYRCDRLKRPELLARAEQLLVAEGVTDPTEWRAAAELMAEGLADAASTGDLPLITFGGSDERFIVFARFLLRRSLERPVIVWLDDAHDGLGSLQFADFFRSAHPAAAVLFLLTIREDLLPLHEAERDVVDRLVPPGSASRCYLGPLTQDDQREMLERNVGLSGELASAVMQRTAGNPLFAMQLLGAWMQRDELTPSRDGLVLAERADLALPTNLHALWDERLSRCLLPFAPERADFLCLAAMLGHAIELRMLDAICLQCDLVCDSEVLDALLASGLLRQSDGHLSFSHPLLRDRLEVAARSHPEWRAWNRICATVTQTHFNGQAHATLARAAQFLAQAGCLDEAIARYAEAADDALSTGETLVVPELLRERGRLLREAGAAEDDPRFAEEQLIRADAFRIQWDFHRAAEWAERGLQATSMPDAAHLRGRALLLMSHVQRQLGDTAAASQYAQQALRACQRAGDGPRTARSFLAIAIFHRMRGAIAEALGNYERARAIFLDLDDRAGVARCLLGLGHLHRAQRNFRRSEETYTEAMATFRDVGIRNELAQCYNGLAEVARYRGDYELARQHYLEALEIQTSIGVKSLVLTRINLAMTSILQEDYDGAREALEALEKQVRAQGQFAFLVFIYVALLPCLAHHGDRIGWQHYLHLLEESLRTSHQVDADLATFAALAGELQVVAGRMEEAVVALDLAARQWESLEDWPASDKLRLRISELSRR